MPTGYTADLTEKTPLTDVVLRCARGMGALILMRDDPMDAPIKDFEPSDYHLKALENARSALAAAKEMSAKQAFDAIAKHNANALANQECLRNQSSDTGAKYLRMLALVEAWAPPTPDHVGLKRFMTEQLTSSLEHDCHDEDFAERCYPTFDGTPNDWIVSQMNKAMHDINYHSQNWEEEVQRTNARNKWVRDLKASLEQTPARKG